MLYIKFFDFFYLFVLLYLLIVASLNLILFDVWLCLHLIYLIDYISL